MVFSMAHFVLSMLWIKRTSGGTIRLGLSPDEPSLRLCYWPAELSLSAEEELPP